MGSSEKIAAALAKAGVSDQEEVEYVCALLADDEQEDDEVAEVVRGYIEAANEDVEASALDLVMAELTALRLEDKASKECASELEQQKRMQHIKAQEKLVAEDTLREKEVPVSSTLSREERKKREALLAQYGFETNVVGEDGTIHATPSSAAPPTAAGIGENLNARIAAEKEQDKRRRAKHEHEEKVKRDKAQQEREKAKKEKEKKRTAKKERRTGRG
eukprot:TRINITY_DN4266_c0_g1_i1.p2 TRINITY_DN4266_c0_g1~~TRINITY_DN4266_c0_g1_i1.p2  ORF type:complete len:218 (-),score=91.13 TRINITY_DN4266_c0_g1_i1:39-692(-)